MIYVASLPSQEGKREDLLAIPDSRPRFATVGRMFLAVLQITSTLLEVSSHYRTVHEN